MTNRNQPLVLIFAATGRTGKSIVNGLLASGNFRVAAAVRAASLASESVQKLRSRGVEIRVADLETDTSEKLQATLAGVDIVLSAVHIFVIRAQRKLFDAAKAVGTVKRVVPCDFTTPGGRGTRFFHDWKIDIHEYIEALGLPYTYIDVGWWAQLFFPLPPAHAPSPDALRDELVGAGTEPPVLLTDLRDIGPWVARILADPRTLNHAVIVWEWELTHLQVREIGEAAYAERGGDAAALKAGRKYVTAEAIVREAEEASAATLADFGDSARVYRAGLAGYRRSVFVLKENTLENAKRLGYLDAQELYPDFRVRPVEEFVKELLKNPDGVYPEL